MKLIRAGLREDFDSAVSQPIVFGGERILIDANFANGCFGRQSAARESVDVDLTAIGAGRRARESLQFGLQFIGVIRERFEIGAFENYSASVVGRIHADRGARVCNFDFLLFDVYGQPNVYLLLPARHDLDIFLGKEREAFCYGLECIRSGSEILEFIHTLPVGCRVDRCPAGIDQPDGGFCNDAARRVCDGSGQGPGWSLREQSPYLEEQQIE